MIFQFTHEQVMNGTKTQTSRIVKPGDKKIENLTAGREQGQFYLENRIVSIKRNERNVYEVGKTYAVQPGRTKSAIARIRILSISQADVREYDEGDISREGFNSFPAFIKVWCKMHDPRAMTYWTSSCSGEYWQSCTRDNAELYRAWKIIFEVVK